MTEKIRCMDIEEHLNSLWKWDVKERTTDGFKAGDKNTVINKIAVMWKPKYKDIVKAYEEGCNFIVCHESIAALTQNDSNKTEFDFSLEQEKEKFEFINNNNIVIYRCHDLWDRIKKLGVRDTWRDSLFPEGKIIADNYPYYVTEIKPITLEELAKTILIKIKGLKQNGVLLCGDKNKIVSKVATGTGVSVDTIKMKELGADVGIITDDYYLHVRYGVLTEEIGISTISINHNVAEEWAIEKMADYLDEQYKNIEVKYYKQTCPYEVMVLDN